MSNYAGFDRTRPETQTQTGSVTIANGTSTSTTVALGTGFVNGLVVCSYKGTPDAAALGATIDGSGVLTINSSGNVTAGRTVNYTAYANPNNSNPIA